MPPEMLAAYTASYTVVVHVAIPASPNPYDLEVEKDLAGDAFDGDPSAQRCQLTLSEYCGVLLTAGHLPQARGESVSQPGY
jgi:hypothetical protein